MDIVVTVSTNQPAPCVSGNGFVELFAVGGVGILIYDWYSDSGMTNLIATGPTLTAPAGIYYYNVHEGSFGSGALPGTGSVSIGQTQFSNVYVSATTPATTTNGTDGTATIGFVGTNAPCWPISYTIDGNPTIYTETDNGTGTTQYVTLSNLAVGNHTLDATDNYGCPYSLAFTIDNPLVPTLVPIDLDFEFCDEKTTLTVTDLTGAHSFSNTGGYGGPNPELSSVTAATFDITTSNGTEYHLDAFSNSLPNIVDGSVTFNATNFPSGFSDGLAQIKVIVSGVSAGIPWSVEKTFTLFITATVRCCVSKLAANVKSWDNCCEDTAAKTFVKAYNMLVNINYLAKECCFFTKATEVLVQLQNLCKSNNCTTC